MLLRYWQLTDSNLYPSSDFMWSGSWYYNKAVSLVLHMCLGWSCYFVCWLCTQFLLSFRILKQSCVIVPILGQSFLLFVVARLVLSQQEAFVNSMATWMVIHNAKFLKLQFSFIFGNLVKDAILMRWVLAWPFSLKFVSVIGVIT